jgi:hypothetical protein
MEIAFVAQTRVCTFLLDAEGVCRWTIPRPEASERERAAAELCLGAQYVASLDHEAEGLLVKDPANGTRLLFARMGEDGRIRLVRSGPLLEFRATEGKPEPFITERELAEPDETDDYSGEDVRTLRGPKPFDSEPATLRLVTPLVALERERERDSARSTPIPLLVRRGLLPRKPAAS